MSLSCIKNFGLSNPALEPSSPHETTQPFRPYIVSAEPGALICCEVRFTGGRDRPAFGYEMHLCRNVGGKCVAEDRRLIFEFKDSVRPANSTHSEKFSLPVEPGNYFFVLASDKYDWEKFESSGRLEQEFTIEPETNEDPN